MPSIFAISKSIILSNNNKISHGRLFLLTVLLLILQLAPAAIANPIQENKSTTTEENSDSPDVFGTKGQKSWYIQAAGATTLDNEESDPRRFGLIGAGLSKFFANGHSVNLELNTLYISQPDDDALGLNLALLGRWHFIRKQNWSLYVDGGAGIMQTTNDVPIKGASFNFTPQAGAGATIQLQDQRSLMLGLRWHHISHADLFGNNPGRDSIMGYVGLHFPR
jgi:lipid A 3-O-deacylase